MNGNWQWEGRNDRRNFFGGLLRGADGARLRVDRVERGGELRVTLLFPIGGRLELRFLRGESGRELLRVVARGAPGVGEESGGNDGGAQKDYVEGWFHSEI